MILLWGIPTDPIIEALAKELGRRGYEAILLDQRKAPRSLLELEPDVLRGTVTVADQQIDLAAVTAVYPRPYDTRRLPAVAREGPGSNTWTQALAFEQALWAWLDLTPALVINRPSAMVVNNSKPLQLMQIHRAGFETPQTLITTDPGAAQLFLARHRQVIVKSISGVRSKVSRLNREHIERLEDVVWCPTQFQRYIPGREYRVHVVAHTVFACEVLSDADDYRYPRETDRKVEMVAAEIPRDVATRCIRLAQTAGLHVAGLDLRLGTDNKWYCLEANPSPAFTIYEQATGQPIAAAIAELLVPSNGHDQNADKSVIGTAPAYPSSHTR